MVPLLLAKQFIMSDIGASLEEGTDILPRSLSSTVSSDRSEAVQQQSFQNAGFATLFVLIAWHYPRHLIHSETTIATKTPPYQETQAGDVILDFNLMNPVADPATIPCKKFLAFQESLFNFQYDYRSQE